ncbi:4952_t:CDS:1 [Gigaspora margarita]|uniref:4952_t:CDS:1 n=1 Tax=Gigaspora margarita TaxID=4874 RepID=A0ABN7WJF4_GIGMA|nr:4952_t:CDS:1 [Gigaspora margarita]
MKMKILVEPFNHYLKKDQNKLCNSHLNNDESETEKKSYLISQNEYFYDKKCVKEYFEELNEYHKKLTYRTIINGDKIDEKNIDDQINILRKSCSDEYDSLFCNLNVIRGDTNEPFDNYSQKDNKVDDEKLQSYKIRNRKTFYLFNKKDDEKLQFSQYHKIRNRRTLSFYDFAEPNKTHEFQSLRATKKNEADLSNCITSRMNEIDILNDSIKNVKLQLQELRSLFEVSKNEKKDLEQKFCHLEKDLKQVLESLRTIRKEHCQLKEEWRVTNAKFQKEYFALYNFHKFGERDGDVRCMNGVRA